MTGIYKITNKVNGKCYIGQATNIKKRWNKHRSTAYNKKAKAYSYPLYCAIRKYGLENFLFEILEQCHRNELNDKEIKYIAIYRSNNKNYGYNQDVGGHPSHNTKLSEKDVKSIIDRLRNTSDTYIQIGNDYGVHNKMIWAINYGENWYFDDETYPIRKAISIRNTETLFPRLCPRCGIKISHNASHCNKCTKQIASLQHKSKRPQALELAGLVVQHGFNKTGQLFHVSGRTIQKWLQGYNVPYHKKELIDWYHKEIGIIPSGDIKKSRIKQVAQINPETNEIIAIFNNAKEAALSLGKQKGSHISETCNGIHDSAYGFKWKHVT